VRSSWTILAALLVKLSIGCADGCAQDLPIVFQDDFEKGPSRWMPTDAKAWKVVAMGGTKVFYQHAQSKYAPPFRSPLNIAIVKDLLVTDFVLETKALSTGKDGAHRDLCLFWGYQDPSHFYYVHIAKKGDDRANQIFIVNGKERTKISKTTTPGTSWDDAWHNVRVVRKASDGAIAVYFDDMKTPIMTAEDSTFAWGQVGIGSFDDTGMWDDVVVRGVLKK